MTTKYKVGDKVRIVDNQRRHRFDLGTTVTIKKASGGYDYLAINKKGDSWYVWDSDVEPVTVFIVGKTYTTRCGAKYTCVHVREDGSAILDGIDSVTASNPDGSNAFGWYNLDVVFASKETCKGSYYDLVTEERHNFKIDFQIINGKPDWENAKVTGI